MSASRSGAGRRGWNPRRVAWFLSAFAVRHSPPPLHLQKRLHTQRERHVKPGAARPHAHSRRGGAARALAFNGASPRRGIQGPGRRLGERPQPLTATRVGWWSARASSARRETFSASFCSIASSILAQLHDTKVTGADREAGAYGPSKPWRASFLFLFTTKRGGAAC